MNYIYEIIIVAIITAIFINKEKPNLLYLFYGYFFFFFLTFIQIPIKFVELLFINSIDKNAFLIPQIISIGFIAFLTEITQYFTLKKFLHIKNYKNATLFGIGWISLKSINTFTIIFMNFIFQHLNFTFNYNYFLKNYNFFDFIFFFIFNLALTILIIKSIIKRKNIYLYLGIFLNIIISILLFIQKNPTNKLILMGIITIISTMIIFNPKQK